MNKSDKTMLAISLTSLGLLAYNTHLNRKQAQLKGYLGELSDMTVTPDGAIETISSVADSYLKKAYASFETVKANPEVQKTLKDLGVDVVVKDLTLDRTKNILSAYALFKIMQSLKSNLLKVGIGAVTVYALNKNKDKLSMVYNEILGDNKTLASPSQMS